MIRLRFGSFGADRTAGQCEPIGNLRVFLARIRILIRANSALRLKAWPLKLITISGFTRPMLPAKLGRLLQHSLALKRLTQPIMVPGWKSLFRATIAREAWRIFRCWWP